MSDETPEQIKNAFIAFKAELDKKDGVNKEAMAKITAFMEVAEGDSQKRLKEQKAAENDAINLKERLAEMEVSISRKSSGALITKDAWKAEPEYLALNQWCKIGKGALTTEFKEALRTDNDVSGGYLVNQGFDDMITKKITEISAIRSIARVRTMPFKSMSMPIRNTIPDARYEGEGATAQQSVSSYSAETITAFRLTHVSPITMDLLMDANFDMESEMSSDSAEAMALKEGIKFIGGTGAGEPFGFTVDPRVQANFREAETTAIVTATDLLLLQGDLKTGYNPTYVFNRRTLAIIRTQRDSNGQFIWQPGINGVVSNSISGLPYLIANDMPEIGVGNYQVALGDFMRGYTIFDRRGTSIIRDDITLAEDAMVKFTFHRWNNGKVILPETIRLLIGV